MFALFMSVLPFFSHFILGRGYPVALQLKNKVSPNDNAVGVFRGTVIVGSTEMIGNNIIVKLSSVGQT